MKNIFKFVAAVCVAAAFVSCAKDTVEKFELPALEQYVGANVSEVKADYGIPDADEDNMLLYVKEDKDCQYIAFIYDAQNNVEMVMFQVNPEVNSTEVMDILTTMYKHMASEDDLNVFVTSDEQTAVTFDTAKKIITLFPVE